MRDYDESRGFTFAGWEWELLFPDSETTPIFDEMARVSSLLY